MSEPDLDSSGGDGGKLPPKTAFGSGSQGDPENRAETQRVFSFAEAEARRLGHGYLGSGRLLLGLNQIDNLVGTALCSSGATLRKARFELKKLLVRIEAPEETCFCKTQECEYVSHYRFKLS